MADQILVDRQHVLRDDNEMFQHVHLSILNLITDGVLCIDLCLHLTARELHGNLRARNTFFIDMLEFNDEAVGTWTNKSATPISDFLM